MEQQDIETEAELTDITDSGSYRWQQAKSAAKILFIVGGTLFSLLSKNGCADRIDEYIANENAKEVCEQYTHPERCCLQHSTREYYMKHHR